MPIRFLQQKIADLQSALFFPETDAALRITTHVVSDTEADSEGKIWFTIPRPTQEISAFDHAFPAKLDFFKKGKGFYLKVQGMASIVSDAVAAEAQMPEEIRQRIQDTSVVAIQVKVQHANYFENVPRSSSNWIQSSTSSFVNWLLNPKYDHQSPQLINIPILLEH